jgi:DNA-binding IclR family transcriptional regulator
VRAVAAAVSDREGAAIAAIAVSVAGDLDVAAVGDDARRTAAQLSGTLGEYTPPRPPRVRSPRR